MLSSMHHDPAVRKFQPMTGELQYGDSPPPWHAASRDHLATVPPPLAVATLLVAAAVPSRPTPRHHGAVSAHPPPLRVTAPVPHLLLRRLMYFPLPRVSRALPPTVLHPVAQHSPSRIHIAAAPCSPASLRASTPVPPRDL
ncbi:hypothetical protein DFH08DRAFT_1083811 [Mycena albidolilacea]|uniref:Uncharacterized protein n=1 Tax=Mycena albidolilacea TaxID=1033008 RepID=A0AAD7ELT2_9AGAR|nr:hypothetical protein DFH08DRAFT_1083811 [Mycena albidolilacea]